MSGHGKTRRIEAETANRQKAPVVAELAASYAVREGRQRAVEISFVATRDKIDQLRKFALSIGITPLDAIPWRDVFPEVRGNEAGAALRGLRLREALTQSRLSELAGIPQRHISEMENGKRTIGREMAKKLAAVLHTSYKVFL